MGLLSLMLKDKITGMLYSVTKMLYSITEMLFKKYAELEVERDILASWSYFNQSLPF